MLPFGIPELTWLKFGRGAAGASGGRLFQVSGGRSSTPPLRESLNGNPPPPQARRAAGAATLRSPPRPPVLSLTQSEIRPFTRLPSPTRPRSSGPQARWPPREGFRLSLAGLGHLCAVCPVPRTVLRPEQQRKAFGVQSLPGALLPEPPASARPGYPTSDVGENLLCSGPKQT